MKIDENQIKSRRVIGKTSWDSPIIEIETHGGLFAAFAKSKSGDIETLGAAPHKAILHWMVEKKDKGLKWNEDLNKSESDNKFLTLRAVLFSSVNNMQKAELDDSYIVYDVAEKVIGIYEIGALIEGILKSEIPPLAIVRPISLSEPPCSLSSHKQFRMYYNYAR